MPGRKARGRAFSIRKSSARWLAAPAIHFFTAQAMLVLVGIYLVR